MRTRFTLGRVTAATGLLLLGACASPNPDFDASYGLTLPALRAQQTANPEAPVQNQARKVEGLDGRAARESMDRYYKSFREPPPPPPALVITGAGAR